MLTLKGHDFYCDSRSVVVSWYHYPTDRIYWRWLSIGLTASVAGAIGATIGYVILYLVLVCVLADWSSFKSIAFVSTRHFNTISHLPRVRLVPLYNELLSRLIPETTHWGEKHIASIVSGFPRIRTPPPGEFQHAYRSQKVQVKVSASFSCRTGHIGIVFCRGFHGSVFFIRLAYILALCIIVNPPRRCISDWVDGWTKNGTLTIRTGFR